MRLAEVWAYDNYLAPEGESEIVDFRDYCEIVKPVNHAIQ
jgi:hypothetical protein